MRLWIAVLGLIPMLLAQGCGSGEPVSGTREYTLVLLKSGPKSGQLSDEENQRAFAGHFANMERLARERKLLVAGPFGETRHDAALRGLFVLDSSTPDEARAWAQTDPTSMAGVFSLEYHALRTDAALGAALESELARSDAAKAEGRVLKPGDGARGYVLLSAEHGDLARRELEPLGSGGGVFLLATLDDTRCLALLDASNVAEAQQRFGAALQRIGSHALDDWFASDQLARLGEFAAR